MIKKTLKEYEKWNPGWRDTGHGEDVNRPMKKTIRQILSVAFDVMKEAIEIKVERKIVHSVCKEPIEFDSCGNWRCPKCKVTKKYDVRDDEIEIKEIKK